MANLNPEELKRKLVSVVQNVLEAQAQAVNEGMIELRAELIDRIFQHGLDADNSPIGGYSTKPIYVSVSQTSQIRGSSLKPSGKGSKKGQRGKAQFKNGKPRKSQYMPGGYKEFRNVVGRQNSKVDLFLTGSMRGNIVNGTRQNGVTLEFLNDEQVQKARGNEKRFSKTIFAPTEQELEIVVKKWEDDVTNAFFKSFE